MRHRKRGRTHGRSPSHRKAMLRNLASSLFLTQRDAEDDENAPNVKGRIITTLQKAKEVRPLVEKCITIARRSLAASRAAEQYSSGAERSSEQWKEWRGSQDWQKWNHAIAPAVAARRHAARLLGDKQAVRVLFEDVAPRMEDRHGGYTRILRLATPRLGDAGTRAILEFVGTHDRQRVRSEKPAFDDDRHAEDQTEKDGGGGQQVVESSENDAAADESAPSELTQPVAESDAGGEDADKANEPA